MPAHSAAQRRTKGLFVTMQRLFVLIALAACFALPAVAAAQDQNSATNAYGGKAGVIGEIETGGEEPSGAAAPAAPTAAPAPAAAPAPVASSGDSLPFTGFDAF